MKKIALIIIFSLTACAAIEPTKTVNEPSAPACDVVDNPSMGCKASGGSAQESGAETNE